MENSEYKNVYILLRQILNYLFKEWDTVPTEDEVKLVTEQFVNNHKVISTFDKFDMNFIVQEISNMINKEINNTYKKGD